MALERAYFNLLEIIADLYEEAENALDEENDNDASLLFAQADRLYITAENLESIIAEQRE
ncbi:hypothetical protein HC931_27160 [Candidatus Gracilibacteria bacterium]|nr:hypothetical protein [Candidatus Gracilibacteria bacterium]NJM90399.1 hypothetical protein [Hydrococcus sp. RU_2_2]